MSNRLESLSNKKSAANAAGKTSLKFKPKTNVTRRTQEERAKDAPVTVKSEHEGLPHGGRGSGRGGRGSMRGGRGGGRGGMYAGTHLVSSGPLSAGSVSIGDGANGTKTGLTRDRVFNSQSPTPEFLRTLKLKELSISNTKGRESPSPSPSGGLQDDFSDDEVQDLTRINMNKEYRFADEETALFPVRPVREERNEVKAGLNSGSSSNESSPEPESVTSKSNTPTPAVHETTAVKSESDEDSIEATIQQKENETKALEAKLYLETAINIEAQEELKLQSELKDISNLLSYSGDNQNYIIMHLPKILPAYEKVDESMAADSNNFSKFSSGPYHEKGQIGHVNIHRSGKVTINLGNDNVLDVTKGMTSNFLQEVVLLDTKQEAAKVDAEVGEILDEEQSKPPKGKILRLGASTEKLIATPSL
ncbi:DNA-directed RNA polymerase III subunit RPC4 [[Candida] railenensis]|uniref:DNA-directed RNA polymerase III subunit RPC4 n=1 Tax=[Candida] railenensis TaxID=45579 RepID=A0A9P0VWW4_9ASCO|nr:DNA-directed RNA polymerase III subunit RPC4 [[Candida] railenensis]